MVLVENKRHEYLARAKEAHEHAAVAMSEQVKEKWLKIAASYRDLAKMSRF